MDPKRLTRSLLENRDALLGFIFALCREGDAAEEIFQEVALAVVDEEGKGTEVVHFLPWVREIARRRVQEHYRQRVRLRAIAPLSDSMADLITRSFEENAHSPQAGRLGDKYLLECLGRLTERVREIVLRRYRDWTPLDEIAAAVDWKVPSVKVALSRARKALFDCVHSRLRAEEAV